MQQSVTLGGCSRRKAEATCNVNAAIVGRQHKRALIMEVLAARAIRNLFFLHYFLCLCSFFSLSFFFLDFRFFQVFDQIRAVLTFVIVIHMGLYVYIKVYMSV